MKVASHMLFTEAVGMMHVEDTAERASYGSMQKAIDFLACNCHPGVQQHKLWYHQDKKMDKPPVPSIAVQPQMSAETEVSPSVAAEGLLFLAGGSTSPADTVINLTSKTG